MKKRYLMLCAAAAMSTMVLAGPAQAKAYTTDDGNITINLPEDGWYEIIDPEVEFVFTNGTDVIFAEKFDKDEKVEFTRNDEYYNAVVQLSYAYGEDLIVLTAEVVDAPHLPEIYQAMTSIKFKSIAPTQKSEEKKNLDNYTVDAADVTYYANAEEGLNLRANFSVSFEVLATIPLGDEVHVTGIVKLNGKEIGWDRVEYNGMTGYVSAAHLVQSREKVQDAPKTFEEIKDDIDRSEDMYMADGSVVHLYVLSDGTRIDMNGHKVVGIADGACQMYDGTIIYDFDPTKMSVDDYINGEDHHEGDIITEIGENDFAVTNDLGATLYIHDGGDGYYYDSEGIYQFWKNEAGIYIDTNNNSSWYE